MCGGTTGLEADSKNKRGLSPRVRGNRLGATGETEPTGSIPACVGEPDTVYLQTSGRKVYPRVCGGTFPASGRWEEYDGLSPRVRGNPPRGAGGYPPIGSIPACAGEPFQACSLSREVQVYPRVCGEPTLCAGAQAPGWVYPRVCGGTWTASSSTASQSGLSPRVRGNLDRFIEYRKSIRSIPACAGEPGYGR